MGSTDFYVDWEIGVDGFVDAFQAEAEQRLLDLAGDHTDLTGAAVSVTAAARNDAAEPVSYRARVVVYTRPEYLNATKEDDSLQGALKAALSAIERQVREKRERLGKPWEREDLRTAGLPPDALPDGVQPNELSEDALREIRRMDDAGDAEA